MSVEKQAFLIDNDCKVKWAHDEVCVGCAMLVAHPPMHSPGSSNVETRDMALAEWALQTLRSTLSYMDRAFRLAQLSEGSWKVGGDRWAKPDPGPNSVSGYNMGCTALPNRVEHYHHPRMLMEGIRSVDRALGSALGTRA